MKYTIIQQKLHFIPENEWDTFLLGQISVTRTNNTVVGQASDEIPQLKRIEIPLEDIVKLLRNKDG